MTRIPAATRTSLLTKVLFRIARGRYGAVPEPVAVAANHPRLMMAAARHELAVQRGAKVLPESLRQLVVYRVAAHLSCSWCVDFGTMLQRLSGLDVDRLREIDAYATSPRYTELERRALAYADAMTASPVAVTDEQVAVLAAELGHAGVLELTYLIALENMRARMNSALGIVDQGFTSGEACRVPVRTERG
ncbi:carboxymuconolactone decarboxylase family protein [Kutzneria viridogrisea]|uniref:AhpD family alkylhydroperoxidase n=1 Tax=Kutzneria viridogrisea TaxID=47990 RepID=A0ABR6BKX5_9PSEU|nr:AhpD family alkylhydroperoxidase [Kutzneria viridogrisea]